MVAKLSTIFWLNFNGVLNNSNACLFLPLLCAKNVLWLMSYLIIQRKNNLIEVSE